ncbi:MAG TPA: hypothetical protein VKY89_08215 [Thermoanaerobaculia bacterium]|nr:hypothetical protein [Thermoanaerobaculia bacterium]
MQPEPRGKRFRIGDVLHDAWAFDPKLWRGDRMGVAEDFGPAVTLLLELLAARHVAYALAGGMAILKYFEGRNTKDVDLIASPSCLDAMPEIAVRSHGDHFVRARFAEVRLDLLLTTDPLFARVLRSHVTTQHFDDLPRQPVPCATVEGLLLLKLYALPSLYRQREYLRIGLYENDVASLLHVYRPRTEPILDELSEHLGASDLAEVRKLVAELRHRFERRFEHPAGEDA